MELENKKINSAEELREYLDELKRDIRVLRKDFKYALHSLNDYKNHPIFTFEEDEVGVELYKRYEKKYAKKILNVKKNFLKSLNNIDKFNIQTSIVMLYSLVDDLYKNRKEAIDFVGRIRFLADYKNSTVWELIPKYYYYCALVDFGLQQLSYLKMIVRSTGAEIDLDGYNQYAKKALKAGMSKFKNSTNYIDDGSYISELKNS